jgi:signal transduction histidine kinase
MSDTPRWRDRLLPDTLRARVMLMMVAGVLLSQLLGTAIWAWQLRQNALRDAKEAAQQLAVSAAGSIRFFRDLPAQYRPILIEQLRTMGGTRFFVNVNRAHVTVPAIEDSSLASAVTKAVREQINAELSGSATADAAFAWPDNLAVTDDGRRLKDLPDNWVEGSLLLHSRPAPLLVIQTEFEPGGWLLLATTMPDPYFLDNADPLPRDRLLLQGVTLLTVLGLVMLVARSLTRPLQRLAQAASAFGNEMHSNRVEETGTRELRRTARAFNDMQARIQRFVDDRERLFASISHDLKTPITRLKLRTELLDDDAMRADFHEDLDELDVMVKGALQTVKDTQIHENIADVRLDRLVERLTATAIASGAQISVDVPEMTVLGKPLALKRALGNLIDNALRYGQRVEVSGQAADDAANVIIRDHGPGLPEGSLEEIFEPYVRLEHGREMHRDGSGLGLGIARGIVAEHGGELSLRNHPEGGLVATVRLKRQPAAS